MTLIVVFDSGAARPFSQENLTKLAVLGTCQYTFKLGFLLQFQGPSDGFKGIGSEMPDLTF
jgi:hypothetical protein